MTPAILSNGKIVVGTNHGDAYGKLTSEEQEATLKSGFFNPHTSKFVADDFECYSKEIFLIRHGKTQNDKSELSEEGKNQIKHSANFLCQFDTADFVGFTSPYQRCLETASIIQDVIGVNFQVKQEIRDHDEDDPNFLLRIKDFLEAIPDKSIIVSHCDVISILSNLALGEEIKMNIPMGSITRINACQIVFWGHLYNPV